MEGILNVAQYIITKYKEMTGETIDKLKLHKLLYFAQRETFAILNEPLFAEGLEGWRHGPVSPLVWSYHTDKEIDYPTEPISDSSAYIVNNVITQYGIYESWKLRNMTHNEISWINSRKGLTENERGNCELKNDDIRKDAEKVRPYDSIWDMYYDEFDDCPEVHA